MAVYFLPEKKLWKTVSIPALIMALKRYAPKVRKPTSKAVGELKKLRNLTVRSNLVEYAFRNSANLLPLYQHLLSELEKERETFVNLSQGVSETTLIASRSLQQKIESRLPDDILIDKIENLAAITLRLDVSHIYTPGVHYAVFKALAWNNINVIESISSYSEITLLVEQKDLERAFACVKNVTG